VSFTKTVVKLKSSFVALFVFASALTLSGCATSTLSPREVATHPDSAIVAIALSVHNGEAEEIHVVDSENHEKSLSLVRPTMRLAGEDVFLYELDPRKTYTIKSLHNGTYRTKLDRRTKNSFQVEPGTITYICSYMLYEREKNFAEAVPAQASRHTGVGEALMEMFPGRRFKFGYDSVRTANNN
jgi:hypothetical protein